MPADAVLWGIDPFIPGRLGYNIDERISRWMINQSKIGSVELVKLSGHDAAIKCRNENLPRVDFLFIDGDHSWAGIDADWSAWFPLLTIGGIVALHDSRVTSEDQPQLDSVRYTQEVIRVDPRVELIEEIDSLSVFRRCK